MIRGRGRKHLVNLVFKLHLALQFKPVWTQQLALSMLH